MVDAQRKTYVAEAELELGEGVDSRAPGGAVTVALCGHWEHEGDCRWPHHSAIEVHGSAGTLRTVFVAPPEDEPSVRGLIAEGLRKTEGWTVVEISAPAPRPEDERHGTSIGAG